MINTTTTVVDASDQIASLVDCHAIGLEKSTPPNMYIDLEGVKLGRHGSISILTLLIGDESQTRNVYLIDVHTLGGLVFTHHGVKSITLKDILQSPTIPKVFFDVRNDSNALFSHFGVTLQGVIDLQLMESANRHNTYARQFVSGLAKCIEKEVMSSVGVAGKAK